MTLTMDNKTSLLPFQKAFLVTINSMRGLVDDLLSRLGPDAYILSGRINQDILESFFSLVRGRGGANPHPRPGEAKCRVRSLTLMYTLRLGVNPLNLRVSEEQAFEGDGAVSEALLTEDLGENGSEDRQLSLDLEEARLMAEGNGQRRQNTSPSPSSPTDPRTGVTAEQYGMAYVAGYLSAKCRKMDPSLGTPTAYTEETLQAETMWIRLKSQGGLSVPSVKWMEQFKLMEALFCTKHHFEPDHLSRGPRVVESLVEEIMEKTDFPDVRIVRRFVRLRTFLRLSYVNKERRQQLVDETRGRTKTKQFIK